MALLTVLTRDPAVSAAIYGLNGPRWSVARVRSWDRLTWLVAERPVTVVALDSAGLPSGTHPDGLVSELRRRFPSVGIVFVSRPEIDPLTLFRLGRAGIADLALIPLDDLGLSLPRAVERATARSTRALVSRTLGIDVPGAAVEVVRAALDGALLGWSADRLADHVGFSRPHLSVRLRDVGLPSPGHLLLWAKLLHAGRWLPEPGRTAESVSRQLEYSSGAAFRRALRNYVGLTPTEICEGGGISPVLRSFLDECGLVDSVGQQRWVA